MLDLEMFEREEAELLIGFAQRAYASMYYILEID